MPQALAPGRCAVRVDGLRLLLPAGRSTGSCSTTRPTPATRPAATTPSSARAGSRPTSGSRAARSRRRPTTGPTARSRDTCDWSWQETQAGRPVTRTYFGVHVFEGALPVRGDARHAVVGRLDVRGADARPVRARGAVGAALVGRQPSARRCARRSTTGSMEAGYGYWGFSPANIPEGGYSVYGVDGIGIDPDGYAVQQRQDADRPRLPGLPGPSGRAGPAAVGVHERRRHPARRVPRRCATRPRRRCAT